jgi:hypothetical protein
MILKPNPIRVSLQDESGSALFVFQEAKLNRELELRSLLKRGFEGPQDERQFLQLILEDLVSIDGLKDEAGNAISVEQFKQLELPMRTINALILARAAAINERNKAEAGEKNDSAT